MDKSQPLKRIVWNFLLYKVKSILIKNPLDVRFEKTAIPLLKSIDFEKIINDPGTTNILFFAIIEVLKLGNLQSLYMEQLIPTIQKNFKKMTKFAKSSYYFKLLKKESFSNEELFETIRIGYVQLYHKFENYRKSLLENNDNYFGELLKKNNIPIYHWVPLSEYLISDFEYNINDIKNFPGNLLKINWICNCEKHHAGFPIKGPRPDEFKDLPNDNKIKIEIKSFENDISFLAKLFLEMFHAYIKISTIQYVEILLKNDKSNENKRNLSQKAVLLKLESVMLLNNLSDGAIIFKKIGHRIPTINPFR